MGANLTNLGVSSAVTSIDQYFLFRVEGSCTIMIL